MIALYVAAALVALPFVALALLSAALHIAPAAMDRFLRRYLPEQVTKPAENGQPAVVSNYFDIKDDNAIAGTPGREVYLRRYYLSPLSWSRRLFLHNIRLTDRDRAPHNHQWPFYSLILVGKYIEHIYFANACACGDLKCPRRYKQKHAPAGTLLINKPEHTHSVEIVRSVWSLVFIGKKVRPWGFWIMGEVDKVEAHDGGSIRTVAFVNWRVPGPGHVQAPADRFIPWDVYLKVTKSDSGNDSRKVHA